MTEPSSSSQISRTDADRAAWLGLLSRATAQELHTLAAPVLSNYHFEWLRQPEHGLVMVRARIGNSGDRFNVGEATVTRCAVRHHAVDGSVHAGLGHVTGRDSRQAEQVAQLDALLQVPALRPLLQNNVLKPLVALIESRRQKEREQTEASRVRFFTLQPENV